MNPHKLVAGWLMALILLGACAGPPALDPTAAHTAAAPQATPTSAPPFFSAALEDPVLANGPEDSWYSGAVEPGAVLWHAGSFHMFFNGFSGWPAKSAVGYAISADRISWEMVSNQPVLDSAAGGFPGFTYFVSSLARLPDERWAMYLYTLDEGRDGASGAIMAAVAPELAGPWELDPVPVLQPGPPGSWDASRVTQPSVLRVEGEYRMYFSGYENDRLQGGRWIGMAVSEDGLRWDKLPEPVFSFSDDPRDWDAFRVFQPRVIAVEEGFLMLYKSNISVGRAEGWGFATSTDGITWERSGSNPVITVKTYPVEWRRNGIADILFFDGRLLLYIEIMEREGGGYHHGNAAYGSNIFLFTAAGLP